MKGKMRGNGSPLHGAWASRQITGLTPRAPASASWPVVAAATQALNAARGSR